MKVRNVLVLLAGIVLAVGMSAQAQISSGGTPVTFSQPTRGAVDVYRTATVDRQALLAEDLAEQSKDLPPRFGFPFDVRLDMDNSGTWETLADGTRIWRLRIESPGAYSINILYDRFWLPEGSRMFIYNEDHSYVIGSFTARNNKDYGSFSTGLVKGDVSIIEYEQPPIVKDEPVLRISRIVHAYRNLFDGAFAKDALGFGSSGSCNNNVNCPEGADWQDQKRAVCMILTGGGARICSGSMINNVRQDLTPYFLTANHCLGGESSWIIMFNYESPSCANVDGPTWMTVSGTTLRASSSFSDFGLLELSSQPPDSYNVYYAGWSAVDTPWDSCVGIHHPSGDIKKISFDYDAVQSTSYLGTTSGDNSHWRVIAWDDGTTEPGSSGSPLFNAQHQIIGQLHGGYASCVSITSDYYGKVAQSWDHFAGSSSQLKYWLDPDNTGATSLAGRDAAGIKITHDALPNQTDTLNDYAVTATITSDVALNPDSLLVYYQISSVWYEDLMTATGGTDEYVGYIPAQSPGTEIDYYILAVDVESKADTTDTYHFRVIDYGVTLAPTADTLTGPVSDTVWYSLTVTNTGVYADDYSLSVSGNTWPTEVYDAGGTSPLSSSGTLTGGQHLDFAVRVIVPVSVYGDFDVATITAQSTGDPSYTATADLRTVSDGQPLSIPFEESFPNTTFDAGNWVQTVNAEINTVGIDPPSPPYSLNLDGYPTGADTVMSQVIDLGGQSNVLLRYFYERTGGGDSPENNDDLFVEFKDSTGTWQVLQQHLGADSDMTAFEEVVMTLPAAAYHSAFRLRLRNRGTAGLFDDWFVDDIFIGLPQQYNIDLSPIASSQYGPAGDTVSYLMQVTNKGAMADEYTFADSNNAWAVSYWDYTGTMQISSTGVIASGDSAQFIVRVEIDPGSAINDVDTAYVKAISVADNNVFDQSQLVSISAGPPGAFPWYEPFPFDTLITQRWVVNVGGEITISALNPPSSPYAMDLDGGCDTIVTQPIDLSGLADVVLSYYYERGGNQEPPDAGEDLWVEYKNSSGAWVLVNQHPGADPAMTAFQQVNFALPGDAYHSSFQVRLRTALSTVNTDHWFVDNINVDYTPMAAADPGTFDYTMVQGDSTTGDLIVSNNGLGVLTYDIAVVPMVNKSSSRIGELIASGDLQPAWQKLPEGFDTNYDDLKGVDDPRQGAPVEKNAGGPDAFGYFWLDSDDPGGPVFNWVDISGSGFDVVGDLADDNSAGPYPIGFSFPYYDSVYTQLYIGSNGIVGFAPDSMKSRFKKHIPNDTIPNAILAWMWDDLNPTDANNPGAHVYVGNDGGNCVIQFVDYPEYAAGVGDVITAEIILSPDGSIMFQYLTVPAGFDVASSTVGIENPDGTDGLEVAYLTAYVKSNLAVQFVQPYRWLSMETTSGALAGGAADTLPVKFTTVDLDSGLYQANIVVSTNDPANPTMTIPASLTVTLEPQYICGDVSGNGEGPNVEDLTYLVAFLFQGGPPPPIPAAADMDGSGEILVDDLTYLVSYLFQGGPAPVCGG